MQRKNKIQLNLRVPPDIARRYKALAALKGMDQTELIVWLIRSNEEAQALPAPNVLDGGEPQKKQMSIVR